MAASIVTHHTRTPLNDRAAASWSYSGEAERRGIETPGQLWEREAERFEQADAELRSISNEWTLNVECGGF